MAIGRPPGSTSLPASRSALRDPLLSVLTFLLVIIIFVVVPLHAAGMISAEGYGFMVVLLLSSCALMQSRRWTLIVALGFGVALAALAILLRANSASMIDLYLDAIALVIIDVALIVVVVNAVFAPGPVTLHRINGAILLYLTIGMTFAGLYTLIALSATGAITGLNVADTRSLASTTIYFSFTTLTSVGYGDLVPTHPFARAVANVEAIFGQLFPATLIARLVTLELEDRQRKRRKSEGES